jgi:membrane protein DedA with SNARE-associated domain
MKYKYLVILFVLGFIGRLFGSMLKITHNRGANEWMWASFGVMVLALLLFIIKLIMNKNPKDILNK